jgi:hypothetical protein
MINTLDKNCSSKFGLKQEQSKKIIKSCWNTCCLKCKMFYTKLITLDVNNRRASMDLCHLNVTLKKKHEFVS